MSEKKAKELRNQEPQKVAEISIVAWNNGKLEVKHPPNFDVAINMLLDTLKLMYKHAIQILGQKEKPTILVPKKDIVLPRGSLN